MDKKIIIFNLNLLGELINPNSPELLDIFSKETLREFSVIKGKQNKEKFLNNLNDGYVYHLELFSKSPDFSTILLIRLKEPELEFLEIDFLLGNPTTPYNLLTKQIPEEILESISNYSLLPDSTKVIGEFRKNDFKYYSKKIPSSSEILNKVLVTKIKLK